MISINLLDWRSKRIKILNHRFAAITVVAVIITALLTLSSEIFIKMRVNTVKDNIGYIDSQLRTVEDKIQTIKGLQESRELLLSRRKIIESLQESRPLYVKLFDNMVRIIPNDITLKEISRKADQLDLTGVSTSNSSIASLVDKLQELSWVTEAKIAEIKVADTPNDTEKSDLSVNSVPSLSFRINVTIKAPQLGTNNAAK